MVANRPFSALSLLCLFVAISSCLAFAPALSSSSPSSTSMQRILTTDSNCQRQYPSFLKMAEDDDEESEKAAPMVSGEELEKMLTEWDMPLVVDAYATWCGPCLLMAPEFEAAAAELKGKVRFVKLDTDKEETMAARLNIMGLPTLLFLDKFEPPEGEDSSDGAAKAVLKGRIEGALRKQNILDLANHHFFDGPAPQL